MITIYFFSISGAKLGICSCNLIAKTLLGILKKISVNLITNSDVVSLY